MSSKQIFLNLKEKIEVIEFSKKGESARKQAAVYGCSKTHIKAILKDSEDYLDQCFQGVNLETKTKRRKTRNEEFDERLLEWLFNCRFKGLTISGPVLQENMLEIAEKLKIPDFKTSNGWLEKFSTRHSIVFRKVTGEAADCRVIEIDACMKTLPSIIAGYEPQNIFNYDETGLFSEHFLIKR